jgi:hypothetical protein
MIIDKNEPTYVFDEAVACRLRNMAYNLGAAIDELLARSRVDPVEGMGFEELGFWEAKSQLHERLSMDTDDF